MNRPVLIGLRTLSWSAALLLLVSGCLVDPPPDDDDVTSDDDDSVPDDDDSVPDDDDSAPDDDDVAPDDDDSAPDDDDSAPDDDDVAPDDDDSIPDDDDSAPDDDDSAPDDDDVAPDDDDSGPDDDDVAPDDDDSAPDDDDSGPDDDDSAPDDDDDSAPDDDDSAAGDDDDSAPSGPEVCGSGFDEDGDGSADCADSDCAWDLACQPVLPDMAAPRVVLLISPYIVDVGDVVTIEVLASDDVGVTSLGVEVDGTPLALTAGVASYTATYSGMLDVEAEAEDAVGNTDVEISTLIVIDPSDVVPPVGSFDAALDGATITAAVELVGTVADDSGLIDYALDFSPAGQDDWTRFAGGPGPIYNDVLGVLDPTLMYDGWTDVRLQTVDVGGNVVDLVVTVRIDAPVKTGNMTVEFEDLRVPMAGVPILLKRRYDSRKRSTVGDFGHGWELDSNSVRITKNRPEGEDGWFEQLVLVWMFWYYQMGVSESHQVSIDLGGGEVREFDFTVSPALSSTSWTTNQTGAYWNESTFSGSELVGGIGEPASCYLVGDDLYGGITGTLYDLDTYQLVLQDGTYLHLSRQEGILHLSDPNGNGVDFTDLGIDHSGGQSVVYVRDTEDRITQIVDPDGGAVTYSYDAAGDLVAVADRDGNTTTFTYTADHYLQDVHDPTGARLVRNYYDDAGRLIQQCDGLAACVEFDWNPLSGQELRTDRNGYTSIVQHDAAGNIVAETDPLGRTIAYTWDANGNMLTETNPSGAARSHVYSGYAKLSSADFEGCAESWTYDASGRVTDATDALGNVLSSVYDVAGNLAQEIDRLGHTKDYVVDASGNVVSFSDRNGAVTTWTYDASGWKTGETDPEGNVTAWTYDGVGRRLSQTDAFGTTWYGYDDAGLMVEVIAPDGSVDSYTYDEAGRETSWTDALGRVTSYVYDYNGNRVQTVYPDGTSTSAEFDGEGRKVSETDELGNVTVHVRDGAGQVVELHQPDGGFELRSYDDDGNLIELEDVLGNLWTYSYDANGNRLSETDPLGETTSWAYDCAGRAVQITNANGVSTDYEYDAEGRKTLITRAVGTPAESVEQLIYDAEGNTLERILPDGTGWTYSYDGNGKLLTTTDPLGAVTAFTYDGAGNRLTQTDALGRTTAFTYDSRGDQTSRTTPAGRSTTWQYDPVGRLVAMTDAAGEVTTYEYDDRDRLTGTLYADGTTAVVTYDARGNQLSVDLDGEVTSWTYDPSCGCRTWSQLNPDGSTLAWTYDALGRQETLSGTSGSATHSVERSYDAASRLATVSDSSGRTATYYYDAAGNRIAEDRSNATSSTWSYDAANRLTDVLHTDSTGLPMQGFTYTLDAIGNRIQLTEQDGSSVDWTYDAGHRLISETRTGPASQTGTWAYDAVGNRVEQVLDSAVTAYAYDDDDRMLTAGVTAYTYDELGRQLSCDDGTDLDLSSWDALGRLVEVTRNGGQLVSYGYDAMGNRTSRTDSSGERRYLVDGARELAMVLLETDDLGSPVATYTYGDDLVAQDRGGERWYYKDGLGSVRGLADELGNWTDTYVYDAWGRGLLQTGATPNDYMFAGEQVDPLTGHYYLRARYMDPESGRFLSHDPASGSARDPISLHRYLYTPDDPVNFVDPSGEFFGIATSAAMFAVQFRSSFLMWTLKSLLMTTYVLNPATQLMRLGGNLGGPLGMAVTRAGAELAKWGMKWILVQFAWAIVYGALPIVGWILMVYTALSWRKQIMFMARHRALIPMAVSAAARAEGVIRNLPDDIPRGNRFSDCVEAQSGIPAQQLERAVTRFVQDHGAGRNLQPSMVQLMEMMVPVYTAIDQCVRIFQGQPQGG
jgi:RHS repeat-associated protein